MANIGQPPLVLTRKSANFYLDMKGIKLRKSESSTMPWEVYVSKSVFGKKIRKRFENRADAQTQVDLYETKVRNNGRQELDPDLHKLVALYQDKMTVPQFATMLEEGVRRYSVTALPLKDLVEEEVEHKDDHRTLSRSHTSVASSLIPRQPSGKGHRHGYG